MWSCCVSDIIDQQKNIRTRRIEQELERAKKKDDEKLKVLFLGTGESGKSTIFKQMQILAKEEFADHEKENFRGIIRRNMIGIMQDLIEACEQELEGDSKDAAALIEEEDDMMDDTWTENLTNAIEHLWTESKVIRGCYTSQRDKLHIPNTAAYFFDEIRRISHAEYVPTTKDILRTRNRTTGIHEKTLLLKDTRITFTDVGGQRNERRKWIHCFEDVTAVMFVAAISEYNQKLYEDEKQFRLTEALEEFERIVNHAVFKKSGMILFLNKIDLLAEKLEQFPFAGYGYTGANTEEEVKDYIKELFENKINSEKNVYTHFTCGLDTDLILRVFEDCKKHVLFKNLDIMGFV